MVAMNQCAPMVAMNQCAPPGSLPMRQLTIWEVAQLSPLVAAKLQLATAMLLKHNQSD